MRGGTQLLVGDLFLLSSCAFPFSVQYAYDTLLFLKNDLDTVVNLKWILSCFEQMSGMRINF
jgi:hypothetical protein